MRVGANSFRGEAPRLTPRELPENGAQSAVNARLQSGDLEAWRQFALTETLAQTSFVDTIYLLNDTWLSWSVDVDVARGAIAGDDTYRIYITGPELYGEPRFSNYALATTGSAPYPVTTRPLGVPGPESQPSLVAGVSTAPSAPVIEIVDNGDALDDSWTVVYNVAMGSAVQDAAVGNGAPSYRLSMGVNNFNDPIYMSRNFNVEDSDVVTASFDFMFDQGSRKRMTTFMLATFDGAGIAVRYNELGKFHLGISSAWRDDAVSILESDNAPLPIEDVWYTCQVTVETLSPTSRRVTASLYLGSVQVGETLQVVGAFVDRGGYFGHVLHIGEDFTPPDETHVLYDNLTVRGTTNTNITRVATSYVYTFVNDLGEESAPSAPSATIVKDDATAITVTTAVAIPSGISSDYAIATKRIYRATTGNTGTAFLFVAEIPLAQADYVDELTDAELGDPIESELWDLPPDDLRGILALPNGIMVGFRRNQLCFSAQNRPHAWPVQWRLNTDTDIVAIGNIDNTVVIGTEAFPYLASGNDPSAYSMSKLEVPQACVSKRSLAYLTNIGVIFASPDGLIAVSGNGRVANLTEQIYTRRQWQALEPETVLGVAHDDVYHFWFGGSGFILSLDFEAANGSQVFTDQGSAKSVWAASGPQVTITTASPLAGASSLNISTQTAYLATDAVPGVNMLPATDDWDISMRASAVSWISGSGVGVYLLSIQGPAGTAGDTQFVIATDQFRHWGLVLSDGVTRTVYLSTAVAVDGTAYAFSVTRRGSQITLYVDGVAVVTASFVGALNVPTGRQIRIGQPEIGTQVGAVLKMDTIRFFAYNAVGTGYALDMKPTGFGLVSLSYHARAAHADPLTDKLHLLLDGVDEPSEVYLPVPSSLPALSVPYSEIYEFDSPNGDGDLVYQWKGKLNLLPRPAAFTYCRVKAADYANLVLNLYADGAVMFSRVVADQQAFTLPMSDEYDSFEIELVGTSRVRSVQVAESIEELV